MNVNLEVLGWALSTITITVNPSIEIDIHTEQRDTPILSHDVCIKEHGLSLLTGKRETDLEEGRRIEMCTPVLREVK